MPENAIPAVIAIAILMAVIGSIGFLFDHPPILIGLLAVIGGAAYLWQRRKRARNRV